MKSAFLFAFFWTNLCGFSQEPDTNSLKALIHHAICLYPDKTDSVQYYASYIATVSEKRSFNYGKTYSNRLKGTYHRFNDNFDSAIIYYQKFRADGIKYQIPEAKWLGTIDVADVYMNIGQYEYAKNIYFSVLKLTDSIVTNRREFGHLYNAIAGAYQYMALYDSAKYYYLKAIESDAYSNDTIRIAERKSNLSEVLMFQGNYRDAETYLKESFVFNRRNNLVDALGYNYLNLGRLYLLKGDFKNSENYYRTGLVHARLTTLKFKQADALNGLSALYKSTNNFKKALEYKLKADSVYWRSANEIKAQNFKAMEERHNKLKKEQENYELYLSLENESENRRELILVVNALVLFVILLGIAYYGNAKKKKLLSAKNDIISQQNEQLSKLNEEKNMLIGYLSHDLATPLVNILLCTRSMAEEFKKNPATEKSRRILKNMEETAESGYGFIRKVLTVESGEYRLSKISSEQVDVAAFADKIKQHFSESFEQKNLRLIIELGKEANFFHSDENRVMRIVENLLSNAYKFSEPGKRVWFSIRKEQAGTVLQVRDEGPGIAQAEQHKLFQPYTKLSNKPTGEEGSNGLGLFIVKRLADEMGARLELKSEQGAGTIFSLIIPTVNMHAG